MKSKIFLTFLFFIFGWAVFNSFSVGQAAPPVPLEPDETVQVYCSDDTGIVQGVPDGQGWLLSCLPYTSTATDTPTETLTPTLTATSTPSATDIPESTTTPTETLFPTHTPTETPFIPTETPDPEPTGVEIVIYNSREAVDGFVRENSPNTEGAETVYIATGGLEGSRRQSYLWFDLSFLPADAIVQSASLHLWSRSQNVDSTDVVVYPVSSANSGWTENVSWNYRVPRTVRWAGDVDNNGGENAGGSVLGIDYSDFAIGSFIHDAGLPINTEIVVSLNSLIVEQWIVGNNYGIVLVGNGPEVQFRSSEFSTVENQPLLVVEYLVGGGGVVTPTPTATLTHTPEPGVTPSPTPTNTPSPSPTPSPTVPAGSVELKAFPEAEGFGKYAVGGRGGTVYKITNLNDSGTGSLRACVEASGPRICVFTIGGTINLLKTLEIRNPYITIAGQTAPGGGVQLKVADPSKSIDLFKISTHDVIVRYLKLRPGTSEQNARAMSVNAGGSAPVDKLAYNIICDHCTLNWAGDEILIAWDRTHHVTWQWSIIAESIAPGWKGPNLGKYGGGPYTMWMNNISFHAFRTPNSSASGGTTEIINNLIYNFKRFGKRSTLGSMNNVIGNYIEAGPDTQSNAYYIKDDQDVQDPDSSEPVPNLTTRGWYFEDNFIQDSYAGSKKIQGLLPQSSYDNDVKTVPYPDSGIEALPVDEVYNAVLAGAGAIHGLTCSGQWYYRPDEVERRLVEAIRNDRSSHNTSTPIIGYINSPAEVGGWPALSAGEPCPDTDADGMPDSWEIARGFDPNFNDSAEDADGDGYTNIEEYLNGS